MEKRTQKRFRKSRRTEKNVFLFCNTILLVAIIIGVWAFYNEVNNPKLNVIITTTPTNNISHFETIPTSIHNKPIDIIDTPETLPVDTPPTNPTIPEDTYPIQYTVSSGDTWINISKKFFNNESYSIALAYINGRSITDYIYEGEIIIIENEEYISSLTEYLKCIKNELGNELITFFKGPYGYSYGTRPNPAINITINKDNNGRNYTEEIDTSDFEYAGEHKITGYDPYCTHCCSGTGLMASGVYAVNGYSVAAGAYPIGTTLYIEGYGFYVVEDRGSAVNGKHIDIAAPSHEACYALTANAVRVYIVPNNN